jgi:hypothetical protein
LPVPPTAADDAAAASESAATEPLKPVDMAVPSVVVAADVVTARAV